MFGIKSPFKGGPERPPECTEDQYILEDCSGLSVEIVHAIYPARQCDKIVPTSVGEGETLVTHVYLPDSRCSQDMSKGPSVYIRVNCDDRFPEICYFLACDEEIRQLHDKNDIEVVKGLLTLMHQPMDDARWGVIVGGSTYGCDSAMLMSVTRFKTIEVQPECDNQITTDQLKDVSGLGQAYYVSQL